MTVVASQRNRFGCPVGRQGRRQVVSVDRDDLADRGQRRGFGRDGLDAAAEENDVDVTADGLRTADALGRRQVERLAVVFTNNQYVAHIKPRFFSSCSSCAASSTMMPLARWAGGA